MIGRPKDLQRWRKPALVAASVLAHALILGGLGLRAIHMEVPPLQQERVILVEIEPAMADEIARRLPFERNSLEVALLAAQLGVGTRVAIQLWSTQDPDVDVVDYGILMVRAWAAQADALIAARQLA